MRRVLGLGRGARHKVLAGDHARDRVPARPRHRLRSRRSSTTSAVDDLITYGEYTFFIGERARALRGARRARGALPGPAHGHARPLSRRPARPQPLSRSPRGSACVAVMLLITVGPAALHARSRSSLAGFGPTAGETPLLVLRILAAGIATALLYASLSMAVSSFTTRRAAAAVGVVLLLFVPVIVVRSAIESADAPERARSPQLPVRRRRSRLPDLRRGARGRARRSTMLSTWARRRRPRRRRSWRAPSSAGSATAGSRRSVERGRATRRRRRRLEVVRPARRGLGRQLRHRPRRDRAPRPERRRQVDDVPDALRARPALEGHRSRPRRATRGRTRA